MELPEGQAMPKPVTRAGIYQEHHERHQIASKVIKAVDKIACIRNIYM